jgi:RNA recognition motif-containing protein
MASKTLYVGNLTYDTTEEELQELFSQYGPVDQVRLISSKGFAFVDVPAENAGDAIGALNGQEFKGRTLRVDEARPRREGFGGGGGGGGGRGGGRGGGGRGGGRRDFC